MTNQVVSVPLPHTSGDPDFTAWVARLGLRTRMVMLVGVAALPMGADVEVELWALRGD